MPPVARRRVIMGSLCTQADLCAVARRAHRLASSWRPPLAALESLVSSCPPPSAFRFVATAYRLLLRQRAPQSITFSVPLAHRLSLIGFSCTLFVAPTEPCGNASTSETERSLRSSRLRRERAITSRVRLYPLRCNTNCKSLPTVVASLPSISTHNYFTLFLLWPNLCGQAS